MNKGNVKISVSLLILLACICIAGYFIISVPGENGSDGHSGAKTSGRAEAIPSTKNVILMIADGMGYNHSLAAGYYRYGENGRQAYNHFPVALAMSTYPAFKEGEACYKQGYDPAFAWQSYDYVTRCYTDSAASATAMATGIKTLNGAIGVDIDGNMVRNVVEAAEDNGKATGIISSNPFSHATPAAFCAHNPSRLNMSAISAEIINNSGIDVVLSSGHPLYDNDGLLIADAADYNFEAIGKDEWSALVAGTAGGDADGDGVKDPWTLVQTRLEFQQLASASPPSRIMGVARVNGTLQQGRSGDAQADPYAVALTETVPSLTEMTHAALNVLKEDPDGFFLMVEGGAVDYAAHFFQSGRMIEEQLDFDDAVDAVITWVEANSSWDETVLIVTADHETGYLNGPGTIAAGDWRPIVNKGKRVLPGMEWSEVPPPPPDMQPLPPGFPAMLLHTNSLIPVFMNGNENARKRLLSYADEQDPVRGAYLDNTELGRFVLSMIEGP